MTTANNELIQILNPEMNFFADMEECESANCDIIDCIVTWCSEKNIELEQVVSLIKSNQIFKLKLTKEADRLNFLKKKKK